MAETLCPLLMQVNHAQSPISNLANVSFNAIRENKILTKISEFTLPLVYCAMSQLNTKNKLFYNILARNECYLFICLFIYLLCVFMRLVPVLIACKGYQQTTLVRVGKKLKHECSKVSVQLLITLYALYFTNYIFLTFSQKI